MIDGPNATGYDNSMSPNVLYVLCTTVSGVEPALAVSRAIIGSDPVALAKQGAEMKAAFPSEALKQGIEFHYRVVQAG